MRGFGFLDLLLQPTDFLLERLEFADKVGFRRKSAT